MNADQAFDLQELLDGENGQRAAIVRAVRADLNGVPALLPDDLDPATLRVGTLFVLRRDPRADLLLPRNKWGEHLETVADESFVVKRLAR